MFCNLPTDVSAIGFKAVHARGLTGVHRVNSDVLDAMEAYNDVAPAHNPIYIEAMRRLYERFPALPLVAAFETGFHRTMPEASQRYAVPNEWAEKLGIRRWGFHGASHRYIAGRMAELLGRDDLRVISCHLGGSASLAAIRNGKSIDTSMGMSPQSGLPQNNRVGDFDVFALPAILRETGLTLEEVLDDPGRVSRAWKASAGSNDLREIEAGRRPRRGRRRAGDRHVRRARPATTSGAFLLELGGADAIVFTGGHRRELRPHPGRRLPATWTGSGSRWTWRRTPPRVARSVSPGRLPRPDLDRAHQRGAGRRTPDARPAGVRKKSAGLTSRLSRPGPSDQDSTIGNEAPCSSLA